MKKNVLIFSIIKNNYANYDKSPLLESLSNNNELKLFTIHPAKLERYQIDNYNKCLVDITYLDDIKKYPNIDISNEELEDICMHSYLIEKSKNDNFSLDIYMFETKARLKKIVSFIREKKIDAVLVWGNNYYSKLFIKAARICGIKNMILEEGYYRDRGIQASKVGSNYESEFSFLNLSSNTNFNDDNKEIKENIDDLLHEFNEKNVDNFKYVFIPLQINTDTQILLNSPLFSNMFDFVEFVIKEIEKYNIENKSNLKMIFKVHPEHKKQDRLDNFEFIYETFKEKAIFVEHYNLDKLINNAEFIITINSTVGFQAIDKYKKVIVLGNAIYELAPNVIKIKEIEAFSDCLHQIENLSFTNEQVNKFKNSIIDFQIPFIIKNPSENGVKLLLEKLFSEEDYYLSIDGNKYVGNSKYVNIYLQNCAIKSININNKSLNDFDFDQYKDISIKNISLLKYINNITIDGDYDLKVEFCEMANMTEIDNKNLFTFKRNNSKSLFVTFSKDDMNIINSNYFDFLNISDHISDKNSLIINSNAIIDNLNSVSNVIESTIQTGDYEKIYFFGSSKYGNMAAYFSKKFPKSKLIALTPVDKFDTNYEKDLFTLDTEYLNMEDIFIISNIHENNEKIITTSLSFEEVMSYYKENQDQIINNVGKQKVYYVNLENCDMKYTLDSLVSKNNNEFIFLQYNSKISINHSDLLLPLNKGVEKKFLSSNPYNVVMNILFHNLNIPRSLLYIEFGKNISDQSFVSNWCGAAYLYRLFNLEFNGPFAWGYLSENNYISLLKNEINHSGSITISRNAKNLPTGINENGVHMVYNHYINYDDEKIIELHNSRVAKFNNVLLTFSVANSKTALLDLIALELENHIIFTTEDFKAKNVISKPNWKDSIEPHIYCTGPWAYVFTYLTDDYNVLQFFEEIVKKKNPDINDYKI